MERLTGIEETPLVVVADTLEVVQTVEEDVLLVVPVVPC